MKRIIPSLFLIIMGISATAQSISVKSFQALPMDMTASSLEGKRIDQNNELAALIKIVTSQTGFTFEAGALGVVDTKQETGEVWVWVPRGSRKITIKHQQLGVLCDYRYPVEIQAERTYEMVLVTGTVETIVKEEVRMQYLTFQVAPPNAILEVNDQLWSLDADGIATKYVDFGTYTYRVRAADYFPDAGRVTVDDPNNTKVVAVTLKSNRAEVTLKVDADAEIWVNNEKKGTRSWTGSLGNGTFKIECKQDGHETSVVSKEITTEMNGQTITLPAPRPIYGSLNVESTPQLATLYIDGKEMGKTPKSVNEILVGEHEIKIVKENYRDYVATVTIRKGERTQVAATLDNVSYEQLVKQGDEYYDAKNYAEALKCYREAAEQGNDPAAQTGLGKLYYYGRGVTKDYTEAMKWFKKAQEQGYARAILYCAEMYAWGHGVVNDREKAIALYTQAGELGDGKGYLDLAGFYRFGNQDFPKDEKKADKLYKKAVKTFSQAADAGDAEAQFYLAYCHWFGFGVSKDWTKAAMWYQLAAEQGHSFAKLQLGYCYFFGLGVAKDEAKAEQLFREGDYAKACNLVGHEYASGFDSAKDYTKAMQWYRKAADLGDAEGQYNVAGLYRWGDGVPKSVSEAEKWYLKAAEGGYSSAWNSLGDIYRDGAEGVEKDYAKAMYWYRKDADEGHSWSQYEVGQMYENGEGVSKSIPEAKKWYQKAADQGYQEAIDALNRLK